MRLPGLSILIVFSFNVVVLGQGHQEIDLQAFVEEVFQLQEEDLDYEGLYESLLLLYTDPIDLNHASQEDLSSLYILDQIQINNFIDYRKKNGDLLSVYELQAVPGFDVTTIRKILPFVTLEERPSDTRNLWQRIMEADNKFLLIRSQLKLEKEKGFTPPDTNSRGEVAPRYLGSRSGLYARFRASRTRDFSLGITMEKDPGEEFNFSRRYKRYGPDFISGHFLLENKKNWRSFIVGDYQIQLGQGLLLGAGFNPGKGSETITSIKRSNRGILPYTSVLESGFFRGAAATYTFKNFNFTGFYSSQLQDGSVQMDTVQTDFDEFVTSIQASGLHRTESELSNKDQVREQVMGSNLLFRSNSRAFQAGLTFLHTNFNVPLAKRPTTINQFEFQGSHNFNYGFFSNYLWQNLNFFGEAALSRSGGLGAIGGVVISFSKRLALSVVLRNYERDFHSFYGNAFSEGSRNINERGVYWGVKFSPWRKLIITAYYDRFTFPWLRFRTGAPSDGHEHLIRATLIPSKKMKIYAQFRKENKQRNSSEEGNLQLLSMASRSNYLLNLDYKVSRMISLKSRVQWSNFTFERSKTEGFAIIQDINLDFEKIKIGTRFALFDNDDFENRQFAYEKDVLYAFSIPTYNGVGLRNYILVEYDLTNKLTFWIKIASTTRRDVQVIGSGLDEINGNRRTDLRLQMRYQF